VFGLYAKGLQGWPQGSCGYRDSQCCPEIVRDAVERAWIRFGADLWDGSFPNRGEQVEDGLAHVGIFRPRALAEVQLHLLAVALPDVSLSILLQGFDKSADPDAGLENLPANWHPVTGDHLDSDAGSGPGVFM